LHTVPVQKYWDYTESLDYLYGPQIKLGTRGRAHPLHSAPYLNLTPYIPHFTSYTLHTIPLPYT